jgi:hypothetical protein
LAENPIDLDGISRPAMFLVKNNKIYILDQATVFIYSLKDGKLIKKFGKAGEGPQEFKMGGGGRPLSMSFDKEMLMVNSLYRLSFFDLEGNFIREEKISVDNLLFPVKDKYVGIGPVPVENKSQFVGFTLFDQKFTSQKVVFVGDFEIGNTQKLLLPVTGFTYNPVYKDKIYINASSDEFKINVLNTSGVIEHTIRKMYPKQKIPAVFKEEALDFFKKHPVFKNEFDYIKQVLQIREYFPPIRDLQISEDAVYVITYQRKGELWECLKLDLQGNETGKIFIPLQQYEHVTFYPLLYSVCQSKIYTLVDDMENESWKVYVTGF